MYPLCHWNDSVLEVSICNDSISFKNGKNTNNTLEILWKTNNSQRYENVIYRNECFYVEFLLQVIKNTGSFVRNEIKTDMYGICTIYFITYDKKL